jgi:Arc/MetJ-type ribon-helix-helix transcriptional regulator
VKAGRYQNSSEVVRGTLQRRRRAIALKLRVLRAQIKAGIDQLDRGDFVEAEDTLPATSQG